MSGREQAVEVPVEGVDPAVVDAEPLPDRVAPLDDRVEDGHPRLVARDQLPVDVDEDLRVAGVGKLVGGIGPCSHQDASTRGASIACSTSSS